MLVLLLHLALAAAAADPDIPPNAVGLEDRLKTIDDYRRALEADPKLADDPDFVRRFHDLYSPAPINSSRSTNPNYRAAEPPRYVGDEDDEDDEGALVAAEARARRAAERPLKPREDLYIGVAMGGGPMGVFTIGVTTFLFNHLQLTLSTDLFVPSANLDAKVLIFPWAISLYVGGGVHAGFGANTERYEQWRRVYLYATAGAQYVTEFGMFIDAGVALAPHLDAPVGRFGRLQVMPVFGLGWSFR